MDSEPTFGAWLKSRRRQLDLTQKGLAHQVGCSVGTIRKMEADERRPSRQLAGLLAEFLEIPPDQRETFIAFARSEAYISDTPLPVLPAAEDQILVVPKESTVPEIKHNLPQETTQFVDRETELATLDELLTDHGRRLITILGPGGIGKTRLGIACAERQLRQQDGSETHPYKNGVFFVDLAPLPKAEGLVFSLAEALNLRIQSGDREKRSFKQQLLDYLRNRRMLLVLDNFEHLLYPPQLPGKEIEAGGATLVAEILHAAPEIRILVTSRERLNLHMEQVFAIDGLTYPDWEMAAPEAGVEDAARYTAVQLFLQAARRSQQNFSLETHNEALALVHICDLVDGMPLALELAASWVDTLSLADITAELKRGLDLLETELRDVPPRQRSVRATFDYSWQKLNESEQSVFAQLSIFRGGFTRPAVQAVTGATPRQLSRLVNKSFIKFNKGDDRYQVHELLRQYGAARLGQVSELERAAYDRHSTYYCQALAKLTDDLKGARQRQAISAIEVDIENVRLAWNHALTQQDLGAISISLESLFRFYWNGGWWIQGAKEFERAVAVLRTGDPIGKRGVLLGRLLAFLGWFYGRVGQPDNAQVILRESLDILQRLGTRQETLIPMLFLASYTGSFEESNGLFCKGLALAREIGDQWAVGHALIFMGYVSLLNGEYEPAERRMREALKQFRQAGDLGGISMSLSGLSSLAVDRGLYEEALSLARETISVDREFDPNFPSMGLESLGDAMHALGAYEEAERLFQQGLALERELGNRPSVDFWLFRLGEVAYCMGDYALATQRHQESLAEALECDDLKMVAQNHDALGRLALVQGDCLRAGDHLLDALQTANPLGRPPILLAIFTTTAELFAEEGDLKYAAMLATFTRDHPASQAKVKERADELLKRLEEQLSVDDLAENHKRSQECKLDCLAAQLLTDLAG